MTTHLSKIFYIHLRFWNEDGTPHNRGGTTIGYKEVMVGNHKHYHIAYSLCHPNDNYNKAIGRNIVTGRLQSGDYHDVSPVPWDIAGPDAFEYVVKWVNHYVTYWTPPPPENQETSNVSIENQTDSNHTSH